jgi:DNA-binding transcriptional regulator YhcF (GntR family)
VKISPEQYQALRFLQAYTFKNGEAPTYREIAAHCGIHLQTIVQKFRRMRARGLVDQYPTKSLRPWFITPRGHQALAQYDIVAQMASQSLANGIQQLRKWPFT